MDAVGMKRGGWLAAVGMIGIAGAVWLAASASLDSLGVSISSALEASPGAPTDARPGCHDLPKASRGWQSVDLSVEPQTKATVQVGSASLTASTTSDGSTMQWNSDLGVDAVIIHGDSKTRVERFDDERFFDQHPMPDASTAEVTFCYDLELTVNKDANPSLTRTYRWDVTQKVEPEQWRMKPGGEGVSTYHINVTRDRGTDSAWMVSGTISIDNLTPADAVIDSVADITGDGIDAQVDCGVELPGYILESGDSLNCEYQTLLPDDADRSATATVRTSGGVLGAQANAFVDFDRAQAREVADSITVTDSSGRSWTFDDTSSVAFEHTFRCDDDAGLHPSAVEIVGMDLRASTSVSVDCQPTPSETTASKPLHP